MPTPVASSQRRAGTSRRSASAASSRQRGAGSAGPGNKAKANSSSASTSAKPPVLLSASPASPPKGILLVNSDRTSTTSDDDGNSTNNDNDGHPATGDSAPSAASYLKPLLRFLPRHIDPSAIARLLKNVHPSAFGAYRTKEAWRREHPHVLNTAHHILRQEQAEAGAEGMLDPASPALLRPSTSSDEACLAHSPPSATFSSSEDDDFDDDVADAERGEDERREASELDEYFNDDFDADLGTSPESASSLRDLASRRDSLDSAASGYKYPSLVQRARASSQDSTATARDDSPCPSPSPASLLADLAAATLSSPRSPLAIYLSKPDEELDSPLAGPSQRVVDLQNGSSSSSSSPDRSNDPSANAIPPSSASPSAPSRELRRQSPVASTSAAILYPVCEPDASRPHTPPSPSSTSTSPNPSRSRSQHYPTMPIPRIVKRQRSSSSLASSICTCRSNTSNISSISTASRSSSVTFAPLPEEELKKARGDTRSRRGKSSVMGIKGRRNLLLGLNGEEEDDPVASSSTRNAGASPSSRDAIHRNPDLDESSADDEDEIGSSASSSSLHCKKNSSSNDQFDAIAYFAEEDLCVAPPPLPSSSSTASGSSIPPSLASLTRDNTIKKRDVVKGVASLAKPLTEDEGRKSRRKGSDVTIHYGRNGELIERRPLGVTLEELTLPMKRVKETRGRSRVTNDLSASFSSSKSLSSSGAFTSPPTSPSLPPSSSRSTPSSLHSKRLGSPLTSPTHSPRTSSVDREEIVLALGETASSPESGNEKTPTATPRLEFRELFMTSSKNANTMSSGSMAMTSPPLSRPSDGEIPSLPSGYVDSQLLSSTSPTGSAHSKSASSGGSNDVTPMPTPRAGSPMPGLKMTTVTTAPSTWFAEHTHKVNRDFKLMDSASFTLRPSSNREVKNEETATSTTAEDNDSAILQVSPVVNILALGGLLEDTFSAGGPLSPPASTANPAAPLVSTQTPSSSELESSSRNAETCPREPAEPSDGDLSESISPDLADTAESGHGSTIPDEPALLSSGDEEEGEASDADSEKTPTLHALIDLPGLNDTTHTLHARYRKKRPVGIPHVTASRKRALATSTKKNRKT